MTGSEYPITLLAASVLGLIYFGLCYNVVQHRIKEIKQVNFDQETLDRMVRVQCNFIEYVPIILILLALLENAGAHYYILLGIAVAIIVGRILHAWGLSSQAGSSFGRYYGTVLTWLALLTASITGLVTIFA
jgi:uncharacterized protein